MAIALEAPACAQGVIQPAGEASAAPAPEEEEARSSDLVDIVVTARRTDERLQDVPISITLFNQQQLNNRNITTAGDLAIYTPSLSANARFGAENTSFAIRGFVQDPGTNPSVGVYFADVPALRAYGATTAANGAGVGTLFDLQSVQVLKGPQGTLFGRNTTGGAVLLVPNRPTDALGGYVEGSIGNYDMRRIQGVLNVPVSDRLRIRLGVDRQVRDGYLKNRSPVGPRDFADIDYTAVRGSVIFDVTDTLENYTTGFYSNSDTNGSLARLIACNAAPATFPGGGAGTAQVAQANLACNQVARQDARGDGFYDVENPIVDPEQHIRQFQIVNTTSWVASDSLTVRNIASYGEFREKLRTSVYGEYLILTAGPFANNPARPLTVVQAGNFPGLDNSSQWGLTEELQFQGRFGTRLKWQAGGFVELSGPNKDYGSLTPSRLVCASDLVLQCVGANGANGGQALPVGTIAAPAASARLYNTRYRDFGLYAQGTYELSPRLSVTGGVRYTWDRTKQTGRHVNFAPGGLSTFNFPYLGDPRQAPGSCLDAITFGRPSTAAAPTANINRTVDSCASAFVQKSDAPTWTIDLEYKPVDDMLIYGKYARGYRAGGVKSDAAGLETFGPEKVDSYEVGVKSSFRGAIAGTFNITGFYNDFSNQQLSASATYGPASGFFGLTPPQVILNAGKSRIYGFEAEASLQPFAGFNLQGSYAYLNTKLQSAPQSGFDPVLFSMVAFTQARVGFPLALSPKNKFTVTASYVLPIDDSVGRITFGATFTHVDKAFSNYQVFPFAAPPGSAVVRPSTQLANTFEPDFGLLPSQNLLNLNVNWDSIGGLPVDASLFATNVTKQRFPVSVFGGLPSFGWESAYPNEPRTYGLRLKYRFGE